jgi:hypothetical protein
MKFGWLPVLRFGQQVQRREERPLLVGQKNAERIYFEDAEEPMVVILRGLSRTEMVIKLSQIGFSEGALCILMVQLVLTEISSHANKPLPAPIEGQVGGVEHITTIMPLRLTYLEHLSTRL